MRVGCVHAEPVTLDRDASIARAAAWLRTAAEDGVDVLAFPESFVPGFPYWVNTAPPGGAVERFADLYENAVPADTVDEVLAPVAEAARAGGVSAVLGMTERQGGTLYNALAFVDRDTGGVVLTRRKLVPTAGERGVWGHGDASTLRTTTLGGVRVSGLMCFEHTMALPRHVLAAEQPVLHVAAWPGLAGLRGYGDHFHDQVRALTVSHAITSQAFVLSAMNPVSAGALDRMGITGDDPLAPCPAWSAVIGPSGRVLAEHLGADERIVAVDVDPRDRARAKRVLDVGHFGRPECFAVTVDRTPYSYRAGGLH